MSPFVCPVCRGEATEITDLGEWPRRFMCLANGHVYADPRVAKKST